MAGIEATGEVPNLYFDAVVRVVDIGRFNR